jgi:hypothetical protein
MKNMKKNILIIMTLVISLSMSVKASELVLNSDSAFVPDYKNRFSALVGLNPSVMKSLDVKNLHLAYSKQREDLSWWDFNFTMTQGHFNKMTTNNAIATGNTKTVMNDSLQSDQLSLGVGLQYQTDYTRTILPFEGMYELMSASVTYNYFKDSQISNTFMGPGMIAKLSVLKKFSEYVSFGGNIIYNLAVVKRSQNSSTETSSQRSLTLSHLTFGLDLSLYL